MYRKFSMQNGDGTILPLSIPTTGLFLDSPKGLGLTSTTNFIRIGDDNLLNYQQYEFPSISFTMVFCGKTNADKYDMYTTFVRFLSKKPLYLIYEIPSSTVAYRIPFEVKTLDKTEVGRDNLLQCAMQITPTSFWEDNIKKTIVVTNKEEVEGEKKYILHRPYVYKTNSFTDIRINSVTLLSTPFEFTIDGYVNNPKYYLYDENGVAYGYGKFIGQFDKVYVNSDPKNETIDLERLGEKLPNPYSYQDFEETSEETTFLTLRSGKNRLAFHLGNEFDGSVLIEWRDRYVTV